jgi:hypothetical protein
LRHRWNPKSPPPQVGNEVLIFALVTIVIFMVMYALEWSWNYVVLAPMIVDGKNQAKIDAQADEIASLKEQSELSKKRKEIGIEFAALMRQEVDLRQRLKSALDGDEFTKLIREADDWVNQTVGVLKEAGLPTDAEAFYQVGPIELSSEQLERFAHVAEWKRDVIARLALYRQTLDQIKENRRL